MEQGYDIGVSEADAEYQASDSGLATGSTLGGPKVCLTLKATGAIEQVLSIDHGALLFGSLTVNFWDVATGARLAPREGNFKLRPDHQEYRCTLDVDVAVEERVFVLSSQPPGGDAVDPPGVYYTVCLRNTGQEQVQVAAYAYCSLGGPMPQDSSERDLHVSHDQALRALIAVDTAKGEPTRLFGCSLAPDSYESTIEQAKATQEHYPGPLADTTDAGGDNPLGVFHHVHTLAPGEERRYAYLLTFGNDKDKAVKRYRALPDADQALAATRRRYAELLHASTVVTPNPEVNRGVLWAKANMLRVETKTPTGWAFTNDPMNSSKAVGRDAAWFGIGGDYVTPDFVRASLLGFVERQEDSGMMLEDYNFITDKQQDNGLNVNDNTPLIMLALWHHVLMTGDEQFLARVYPAVAKAARFLVSQENEDGLVWCTATGTGAKGIIGWRNVIEGMRLSGATLEENCECFAALQAAAHMATRLGKDADAREFSHQAERLKEAINRCLANPSNGLYYRNIGVEGKVHDELTSDLVFPLMFGVASDERAALIVQRLSAPDFWTDAGIRTAPRTAPGYSADHGHGLLGGVWVGVTFWFASVAARYMPSMVDRAMSGSFRHYSRDPKRNNTVPGQFSEWLDGESLTNEGMMLSPWFPPRYVWAAIEGIAGLKVQPDGEHIELKPGVPLEWSWLGACDVPFCDRRLTWFGIRGGEFTLYANFPFKGADPSQIYEDDISRAVRVRSNQAGSLGLKRGEELLLFAGNTSDQSMETVLNVDLPLHGRYRQRRLESVLSRWTDADDIDAERLRTGFPIYLEQNGYCLVSLTPDGAP